MESHSDSLGMPLDNHAHLVFPVASRRGGGDGKETETLTRALERGTDTGLCSNPRVCALLQSS